MKKVKLYCIPHAGGSAMVFNRWEKHLHPDIELFPVELAGRGHRINSALYSTLKDAVKDVFEMIEATIGNSDYALMGHSMGSWIVRELYKEIKNSRIKEPVHIFISGKEAPHLKKNKKVMHRLADADFIAEILKLGGTPKEIFENVELSNTFLPILKADYRIIETHEYEEDNQKIDCPISFLNGLDDDLESNDIENWNAHCNSRLKIVNFNGGHFFLYENIEAVTELINSTLILK